MTARVCSVTQARDAQRLKDMADILTKGNQITSADLIRLFNETWTAGHRAGFDEGFERGQKATASAIEAVQGLMP